MRISLDRRTVIELYCTCRQAERSLHRACDPNNAWSKLQAYYDKIRRDAVQRLLGRILARLPVACQVTPPPDMNQVTAAPTSWRKLFGPYLARWTKDWWFPGQEVGFIAAKLEGLLTLLCSPARPEAELLIGRRQEMLACQLIIDARCVGLRELRRARATAHFDQQPGNPGIEISDLLPDAA